MVTTIQISEDLKNILYKYKRSSKDSYEDVIKNLIREREENKENRANLLREGYVEMYGISKEISQEFDDVDMKGLDIDCLNVL